MFLTHDSSAPFEPFLSETADTPLPWDLARVRTLATILSNEEHTVSEERRAVHPQEPAEGEPEDVEAPGVEKAGDPSNPATADAVREEERSAHPDEPAEGGEDEVDEPGSGRPGNAA